MQHLKAGPLRIPYKVTRDGDKKTFHIGPFKIPFSTYTEKGYKYYKIFFLKLKFRTQEKYLISQREAHYRIREQLTEEKKKELAEKIFLEKHGYSLDLDNPRSMNQKIFWLKFNYQDPMVTRCCDKYAVKGYVEEVLGPGYVIPTIAAWEKAEDIDFSVLPQKYVMKVNWSSGYNVIVNGNSDPDREMIREKMRKWMRPQQNSYYHAFNWGYKNMKPMVYAEEYIEQVEGQLYDYKFFCCNGEVKFWFIATDRQEDGRLTHDFFDMDFNKLPFDYGGRLHSEKELKKPKFYEEMLSCARKLSKPFPFVRVDFYETEDAFYVGEMTFYPGGGVLAFTPTEWDFVLGDYIELPEPKHEIR